MRVLGIDPGSTVTGLGVVHKERGRLVYVASSCVRTRAADPIPTRLATIHGAIVAMIDEHRPDAIAIEAIFAHKSSTSALRLGQARGVALLACAQRGLLPAEYNPMTVKRTVGAHGRAEKDAVARMVAALLGVRPDGPSDVTDALAIAITHCAHARPAVATTPLQALHEAHKRGRLRRAG